jgi:DNA-binding beta-propeller fold protein YncE
VKRLRLLAAALGVAAPLSGCAAAAAGPRAPAVDREYAAYVVSESVDRVARVVFGPQGLRVERERSVSTRPHELNGPHGVSVSPDGRYYFVSLGHGTPFGWLWKLSTADDEVLGRVMLGLFPATVDVTPDGQFAFIANFNLHGDHVPSSISKVHLPTMAEVARTETCVMPHGSRVTPDGTRHYSACMMDDLLVEIDVATGEVARLFSVAPGSEGPATPPARHHHAAQPDGMQAPRDPRAGQGHDHAAAHAHHAHGGEPTHAHDAPGVCSPTWAQPGPDGALVYVTCNRSNEVLEIDTREWRLVRRFATGDNPYNAEATPDGRLLLVTLKNRAHSVTEIIDLRSGRTLAQVPSSTTLPHGIAVTADSRFAFVSVEGRGAEPGKVDVIDLRSLHRVASVEVGQQAAGIAIAR